MGQDIPAAHRRHAWKCYTTSEWTMERGQHEVLAAAAGSSFKGLSAPQHARHLYLTRGFVHVNAHHWIPARYINSLYILLLTYLLTPRCRVLLEKLPGLQLVKKFPAFHGTRRFITALTSVRQLSLSWASPIQSIYPHPTSWRSILILSTHLRLGLPSGLFPSGFPTKTLYTPLSSSIRATCPAHLIIWNVITGIKVKEMKQSQSVKLKLPLD